MGDVKLEEAAMAIPIIKAGGDIHRLAEVFRAMGTTSNSRAAVGIILVAIKVITKSPNKTAYGPKGPGEPTTPSTNRRPG